MKKGEARVVLVTCASLKEARAVANMAVVQRLAACVTILPGPVESVYRWKGKLEKAREYLLLMKTTAVRLKQLEREVKRIHSYDVPEFVAMRVTEGSKEYLHWLGESVAD